MFAQGVDFRGGNKDGACLPSRSSFTDTLERESLSVSTDLVESNLCSASDISGHLAGPGDLKLEMWFQPLERTDRYQWLADVRMHFVPEVALYSPPGAPGHRGDRPFPPPPSRLGA